ncbi:MAG: hypothetical protein WBP11_07425, partial [Dokdonella sp.]
LAYENLQDVADGSEAQVAWHEATAMETSRERRAELDMALRRYCANDTLGMVRLAAFLGALE